MQAIAGYTWPGIEFGEPPSCAYTFFEVKQWSYALLALKVLSCVA